MYYLVVFFLFSLSNLFSQNGKLVDHSAINTMVEKIKLASKTPAMAVNVVIGQEVYYQKTIGVRDTRTDVSVDNETLFRIGSATKGFTAALVAKLKQQGALNYYDLVSKHLPCFVLKDPQATSLATIHDLLTHQIGLARHDVMWYNRNFTAEQLLRHLRFLTPSCSFRQHFIYQNIGYTILGLIIENITRKPFNDVLCQNILEPLGMKNTYLQHNSLKSAPNFANGHKMIENTVSVCTEIDADCIAPAGAMISCNEDMAKYLKFLNKKGSSLLDEQEFDSLIEPRVVSDTIPAFLKNQTLKDEQGQEIKILDFECYGYGWILINYRGIKLVFHPGNIEGHTSFVCFLPDYDIAISILSNLDSQIAPHILGCSLIDEFLGLSKINWLQYLEILNKNIQGYYQPTCDQNLDMISQASRPLTSYEGIYEHGAYGDIIISECKDYLTLNIRDAKYKLIPIHPDIFKMRSLENDTISTTFNDTKCQFSTDIHGRIQALRLPLDPMSLPICFEKKTTPICNLQDYLGNYFCKTYSMNVQVIQEKDNLFIKVSGYSFKLTKTDQNTFRIDGKDEYKIVFIKDIEGKICSINLEEKGATTIKAQKVEC